MDGEQHNPTSTRGGGKPERRRCARREADLDVDMLVLDGAGDLIARMGLHGINLGEGGIGATSPAPLEVGTRAMLIIHSERTPVPSFIYAEVVKCEPVTGGNHQMGLKFTPMPVTMLDHKWLSLMLLKAMAA
jgi:hypothetical protein